jgi:hypothetical protein
MPNGYCLYTLLGNVFMKKKLYEKFKAKCGDIAISMEGDYTIIVNRDCDKFKYCRDMYDIHIHNKNGIITIYVYNVV